MLFFQNMKLIYKLLLLYAIVFVIVAVAVGFAYSASLRMVEAETYQYTLQITNQLRISMEHALGTINQQLFNNYILRTLLGENIELLANPELSDQDRQRYKFRMGTALGEFVYTHTWVQWAAVVDGTDEIYTSARVGYQTAYDISAHLAADKALTQEAHGATIWQAGGDGTILVKRMLYDWSTMTYSGYILVNLDSMLFETILEDMRHLNNGNIAILDSSRNAMLSIPSDSAEVSDYCITVMDGSLGERFEYGGRWYRVISQQIAKSNLTLLNIIDVSTSTEALQRFTRQYLFICIFCLCLISLITLVVLRPISKNIQVLMQGIDEIAAGKFDTRISTKSNDEITLIAGNINTMASRISGLVQRLLAEQEYHQQTSYKLLEFQYNALQAQINPHFMFNALESINGIAKLNGDFQTSDLVCRLAGLLRSSLERTDKFCPLGQEVGYIVSYLEFYSSIYPGKMCVKNGIDPLLGHLPVPTFILQPIVENAIVHGIGPKVGAGMVTLESRPENGSLIISVIDDGVGIPEHRLDSLLAESEKEPRIPHKRMGLRNVNERIKILFGGCYGISIRSPAGGGTRVEISIPMEYPDAKEGQDVFGSAD